MMTRTCPRCGADLADDLPGENCPSCLMGIGLDDTVVQPDGGSAAASPLTQRFDEYDLLEEIARGGMGVVYKARQRSLNRLVALKLILSGQFASKQEVLRFRGEAEAAANLRHPNIVAIYETGEHDGQHYFSMEYVQGRDLGAIVRDGPLPPGRAARYAQAIAEAIHYAHGQGILHRDLKPSNILIDSDDRPRVTDFGLAKRLRGDFGVTVTGQLLGSPGFMPPEQTSGKGAAVGPSSDVYGLGAILYHLLTGRPPFQAATIKEVLRELHERDPVPPRLLNASVPRDLETLCLKCLEKDPAKRFATAAELVEELGRFLRDDPIHARPIGRVAKLWRWCRRKPVVAGLLAALHAVAGIGFGAVLWQWNRATVNARNLRERVYASDMNVAARSLAEKNLGRAVQLLRSHIPGPGETDLRGFEWRYLWQQCQGEEIDSIVADDAEVRCLAVSPDGAWFVTGSFDRTLKLWDRRTRKFARLLNTLPGRTHLVNAAFSPDGKLLAVGDPATLHVWDMVTRREVKTINAAGVPLAFLPRSSALVCVTSAEAWPELRVWDPETWHSQTRATNVQSFAVSANGQWLAITRRGAVGSEKFIELFDASWTSAGLLDGAATDIGAVYSMAFSPDGRRLVVGDMGGQVGVWDTETRRLVTRFQAHERFAATLKCSPDGRLLASASGTEQRIALWDTRTWRKEAELAGHQHGVWDLAWTPDGQELLSASRDRTVKFWRLAARPKASPDALRLFGFLPGGRLAVLLDNDRLVLWDVDTGEESAVYPVTPGKAASACAVASAGALVAIGYSDGTLELRTLPGWSLQRSFTVSTNPVFVVRLSPDATEVAAIALSLPGHMTLAGRLGLWNVRTGERRTEAIDTLGAACTEVAFSHNGRLMALARGDDSIAIWDRIENRQRHALKGHSWEVTGLAFSPDDRVLASASWDTTVRLWDPLTGTMQASLLGGEGLALCFSPDGRTLALAPINPPVRLIHVPSQQEIMTLAWDGAFLGQVLFSPDGSVLGAGSYAEDKLLVSTNDRVRFWRAPVPVDIDGSVGPQRPSH